MYLLAVGREHFTSMLFLTKCPQVLQVIIDEIFIPSSSGLRAYLRKGLRFLSPEQSRVIGYLG